MPRNDNYLNVIDALTIEMALAQLDEMPFVPDDVHKNTDNQMEQSGFRPLTEEEKEEFVNSLDAKGKKFYEN